MDRHISAVHPKLLGHVDKRPVALVHVKPIGLRIAPSKSIAGGQIKISIVVKIKPNRSICESFIGHTRLGTDFSEGHVAVVFVQGIGCKLGAHVNVFPSVVVVISNGDRVVLSFCRQPGSFANIFK